MLVTTIELFDRRAVVNKGTPYFQSYFLGWFLSVLAGFFLFFFLIFTYIKKQKQTDLKKNTLTKEKQIFMKL